MFSPLFSEPIIFSRASRFETGGEQQQQQQLNLTVTISSENSGVFQKDTVAVLLKKEKHVLFRGATGNLAKNETGASCSFWNTAIGPGAVKTGMFLGEFSSSLATKNPIFA